MSPEGRSETGRSALEAAGPRGWGSRLWRYGPLVFWMGFIFFASTGNFSAPNTSRIIGPLLKWLFPAITAEELERVHFLIRKTAHFSEYALFALLAARAFSTSSQDFFRRRWALSAFALVAIYALLDEYHQSFVSTRTGTIYDSLLDMSGGACALVVLVAVGRWRLGRRR